MLRLDLAGALVKIIDGIPTDAGSSKLSWNLTDNLGNKVTAGNYKFEVDATNMSGDSMTLDLFKLGILSGVRFTDKGTVLIVNGSEYSISDISEVTNPQ